ncbi:hypothetical protein KAR91_36765 [Candidatus Pacearchaeota archaeon]|nr:hypothetical protein [Candidatus Pacearchaeota archaeon]
MRAIKVIKRLLVIVPLVLMTSMSVFIAYLAWLLMGDKAYQCAMPFESWVEPMMRWAER